MALIDQLFTNGTSSLVCSQGYLAEKSGMKTPACHDSLQNLKKYGLVAWEKDVQVNRYSLKRCPEWVQEKYPDEWKPLADLIQDARAL